MICFFKQIKVVKIGSPIEIGAGGNRESGVGAGGNRESGIGSRESGVGAGGSPGLRTPDPGPLDPGPSFSRYPCFPYIRHLFATVEGEAKEVRSLLEQEFALEVGPG